MERLTQLRIAFQETREVDPRLVPLLVVVGLGGLGVPLAAGLVAGRPLVGGVAGVLVGSLAAVWVFGRRASRAQIAALEGRPGAAAAVLNSLRGPWRLTPAVQATRKQDLVHRVVGRPGVILVGEGSAGRVASLLRKEGRRMSRVVGEVPVHTVSVGEGEGQVPLGKLRTHLVKLGRHLKKREVESLHTKLSALGDSRPPIPKGPIPRGRPR